MPMPRSPELWPPRRTRPAGRRRGRSGRYACGSRGGACQSPFGASRRSSLSSRMVYGPSLTRDTVMWAPNRPAAVRHAQALEGQAELLDQGLGGGRIGGFGEGWPAPAAAVGVEGELADDQSRTPGVEQRQVRLALGVGEDAQVGHLVGQRRAPGRRRNVAGSARHVLPAHADEEQQPGADLAHDVAVDLDRGAGSLAEPRRASGRPLLRRSTALQRPSGRRSLQPHRGRSWFISLSSAGHKDLHVVAA